MRDDARPRSRHWLPTLLCCLLIAGGASLWLRETNDARLVLPRGEASWVTYDTDSMYHLRRLWRLFEEGGPVAANDPYLDHPEGAAIPWPPYYTRVLQGALAPFRPDEEAKLRGFVERGASWMPAIFGALTSVICALAGWRLARAPGALFAGLLHAFSFGSILYGRVGLADHHAFVSLIHGAMLFTLAWGLGNGALESRKRALVTGTVAGALAGLNLGTWVGSLLYVIEVQAVLAVLLFLEARRPRPGLASLGISFHLAAFFAVLPAVLESPWQELHPWIVVNLSTFHPAFLLLGAAVFIPLQWLPRRGAIRSYYPFFVGAVLVLLAAALRLLDAAPARGVIEGFAWVSRVNAFMAGVAESQPLLAGDGPLGRLPQLSGWGALLLPFAWLSALVHSWRRRKLELLPWLVALPPLAWQALRQIRFTDSLALPMAVTLVAGTLGLSGWIAARWSPPRRSLPLVLLAVLGALALESPSVVTTLRRLRDPSPGAPLHPLADRVTANWIRRHTPDTGDYAVMAPWSFGHPIEWAADRPSVATNFGSYTGAGGFVDSARFFLTDDLGEAEEILERRRARYVWVTSRFPDSLPVLVAALHPGGERPFRDFGRFHETVAARLMRGGASPSEPDARPGFLRLVHISPVTDPEVGIAGFPGTSPASWVWERVPGATLVGRGTPGERLELELELTYGPTRRPFLYRASAEVDSGGEARIRVPYCTDAANGAGRPEGLLGWQLGPRSGELAVPEAAVLEGRVLRIVSRGAQPRDRRP